MNKEKHMTCIVCPNSCSLKVVYCGKDIIKVEGAACSRGADYGKNEIINPVRNLVTTVKVKNGMLPLVSVRSSKPIPKSKMLEAVEFLKVIEVEAPVEFHQVILKDILGLDIDIIATREIEANIDKCAT